MENREIKIGNIIVKDLGKVRIISKAGYTEEARVRFIDPSHFEMSNIRGEFDSSGSHIWAITEYEIFCDRYGVTMEVINE